MPGEFGELPAGALPIAKLLSDVREPIVSALKDRVYSVFGDVERVRAYNGSFYLRLVEKEGRFTYFLEVFVPRSVVERSGLKINTGSKVLITGCIGTTKLGNELQITAQAYEDIGVGRLFAKIAQWRELYGAVFARRKRVLPKVCRRIGVVSNAETQGFSDLLGNLRFGCVHLLRTRMQGDSVAEDVASAIGALGVGGFDCIAIVRGGGSFTDLFEFNKPVLLDAIASSPVPVVTAIGHENDVLLADLCADVSVGTPTALGRLLSEGVEGGLRAVDDAAGRLGVSFDRCVSLEASVVSRLESAVGSGWLSCLDRASSGCSAMSDRLRSSVVFCLDRELALVGVMGRSVRDGFLKAIDIALRDVVALEGSLSLSFRAASEKEDLRSSHRSVVFVSIVVIFALVALLVVLFFAKGGR